MISIVPGVFGFPFPFDSNRSIESCFVNHVNYLLDWSTVESINVFFLAAAAIHGGHLPRLLVINIGIQAGGGGGCCWGARGDGGQPAVL